MSPRKARLSQTKTERPAQSWMDMVLLFAHRNPSIAFLLTMFNVRLGWWLFNPRRSKFALLQLAYGESPDGRAALGLRTGGESRGASE
ncbi:MAG: hypothetical protein WAQ52_00920 [Terriglobales bacterium]